MYYHAEGDIKMLARELRKNLTRPEKILWNHLRNRRLGGYKIRRQHPIERFVLDFYCAAGRLAIEIDGAIHTEQGIIISDKQRDEILEAYGINILRFSNSEVETHLDYVLTTILERLDYLTDYYERNPVSN